jgi:hypothetical protein
MGEMQALSIVSDGMSADDEKDRFVSFRLTGEEARAANIDIFRRSGVPDWSRRLNWIGAAVVIAYGFIDPLLWHTGVVAWKIVFLGVAFALNAAAQTWGCGSVKAGVETVIRFSEAGMFCERPFALSVPWKAVRGAFDDGELIRVTLRESLRHPVARHYVIPKRVLPDDGVALRQLLEASLIGKRMLIPTSLVSPQGRRPMRAIANTRS